MATWENWVFTKNLRDAVGVLSGSNVMGECETIKIYEA